MSVMVVFLILAALAAVGAVMALAVKRTDLALALMAGAVLLLALPALFSRAD
jgi:hypothetical protein